VKIEKTENLCDYDHHWAQKLLSGIVVKIPIRTRNMKGEGTPETKSIRKSPSLWGRMESLIYKTSRFKTLSDVQRAIDNIGLNILEEMYKDSKSAKTYEADYELFQELKKSEKIKYEREISDKVLEAAYVYHESALTGCISFGERDKSIKELIEKLPVNIQEPTTNRIQKMKNGENILNLAYSNLDSRKYEKQRRG